LVFLAQSDAGKLLTTDYNLAKLAEFHGVTWLNLNTSAKSLRPELMIGERIEVDLVKAGKEEGQAVGYVEERLDGGRQRGQGAHRPPGAGGDHHGAADRRRKDDFRPAPGRGPAVTDGEGKRGGGEILKIVFTCARRFPQYVTFLRGR